jgi:hypothetical protein
MGPDGKAHHLWTGLLRKETERSEMGSPFGYWQYVFFLWGIGSNIRYSKKFPVVLKKIKVP